MTEHTDTVPGDEIVLLLDRSAQQAGGYVPGNLEQRVIAWVDLDALLDYGVATCPSCEVRLTRCSHCAGRIHCDCDAPADCVDDARRDTAADQKENDR